MKIVVLRKKHLDDISCIPIRGIGDKKPRNFIIHEVISRPEKVPIRIITLKSNFGHGYQFKDTFSLRRIFSFSFSMITAVLFVASFATIGFFILPTHATNTSFVIKDVAIKQVAGIVAGQPIHYSMLVKRSSITSEHYLLPIPKLATQITIKNMLAGQGHQLALKELADQYLVTTKDANFINFSQPTYASTVFSDATKGIFAQASTDDENSVDVVAQDVVQPPTETPIETPTEILIEKPTPTPSSIDEPLKTDVPLVEDPGTQKPQDSPASDTVALPDYIQVDYQVPGPVIKQEDTDMGKLVTVSAPDDQETPALLDVLAFAKIPEIFKVGKEQSIQIQWQNNNNQTMAFVARDLDNNGYLDYLEWTVPHLSTQIFSVNFISKTFLLDQQKNILADVYEKVKSKDTNTLSLQDGQYIKVTFQKILQNSNSITFYGKSSDALQPASMQVYPVYDDKNVPSELLATFENINSLGTYKVSLDHMSQSTNVFEFKVTGNVDIDYMVDPTPVTPETDPSIPAIMSQPMFSQDQQSSVLVKPFFDDGSTNIGFYIPYGIPPVWTWQSETPSVGDKPFSDYWAPSPAVGDYTAVEYFNDNQQFSCSGLSLPDCINDTHFVSQFIFKITEPHE